MPTLSLSLSFAHTLCLSSLDHTNKTFSFAFLFLSSFSAEHKMTDSIKLSELHRTNIEYERQRHLANWFIKSSPHMAKPVPTSTPTKSQQKLAAKNGGICPQPAQQQQHQQQSSSAQQSQQQPLFFVGKVPHGVSVPLNTVAGPYAAAPPPPPPPIQIQSTPIGHKPKLRRFTSQSSSNMFSVDDFENARLARRNELELKQRQLNRYKMNSLSSGGDCSTGDSKGSKFSNDVSVSVSVNVSGSTVVFFSGRHFQINFNLFFPFISNASLIRNFCRPTYSWTASHCRASFKSRWKKNSATKRCSRLARTDRLTRRLVWQINRRWSPTRPSRTVNFSFSFDICEIAKFSMVWMRRMAQHGRRVF